MTTEKTTRGVAFTPLLTGLALWLAATALLLEDAYNTNNWHVQHLAVPILTSATAVAGVLCHKAFARLRIMSGLALLALALLGSALCVLNTLGRTAADRDHKQATAMAGNRVLHERHAELTAARAEMGKECRVRGNRCKEWEGRVDALAKETRTMLAVSVDPRADAIGRLAVLVGLDGERAKAIVTAIEPAALPLFLELGAIVLLGISFPTRRKAMVGNPKTIAEPEAAMQEHCVQSFTREQALHDLATLRQAGSGRYLAQRWGVDPATASRWLQAFEASGAIERNRNGKSKTIATVPANRRLAKLA